MVVGNLLLIFWFELNKAALETERTYVWYIGHIWFAAIVYHAALSPPQKNKIAAWLQANLCVPHLFQFIFLPQLWRPNLAQQLRRRPMAGNQTCTPMVLHNETTRLFSDAYAAHGEK